MHRPFDGFTVDGVKKLADLGVTDVIVGFPQRLRPGHDAAAEEDQRAPALCRPRHRQK
jgi:hypothetical protein